MTNLEITAICILVVLGTFSLGYIYGRWSWTSWILGSASILFLVFTCFERFDDVANMNLSESSELIMEVIFGYIVTGTSFNLGKAQGKSHKKLLEAGKKQEEE